MVLHDVAVMRPRDVVLHLHDERAAFVLEAHADGHPGGYRAAGHVEGDGAQEALVDALDAPDGVHGVEGLLDEVLHAAGAGELRGEVACEGWVGVWREGFEGRGKAEDLPVPAAKRGLKAVVEA